MTVPSLVISGSVRLLAMPRGGAAAGVELPLVLGQDIVVDVLDGLALMRCPHARATIEILHRVEGRQVETGGHQRVGNAVDERTKAEPDTLGNAALDLLADPPQPHGQVRVASLLLLANDPQALRDRFHDQSVSSAGSSSEAGRYPDNLTAIMSWVGPGRPLRYGGGRLRRGAGTFPGGHLILAVRPGAGAAAGI
jgi:hypothetical protein